MDYDFPKSMCAKLNATDELEFEHGWPTPFSASITVTLHSEAFSFQPYISKIPGKIFKIVSYSISIPKNIHNDSQFTVIKETRGRYGEQ